MQAEGDFGYAAADRARAIAAAQAAAACALPSQRDRAVAEAASLVG